MRVGGGSVKGESGYVNIVSVGAFCRLCPFARLRHLHNANFFFKLTDAYSNCEPY